MLKDGRLTGLLRSLDEAALKRFLRHSPAREAYERVLAQREYQWARAGLALALERRRDLAAVVAAVVRQPVVEAGDRRARQGVGRRLGRLDRLGNRRRLELAYSLMFSLPGTPTLYYGEEIGMGEDLEAPGRMAVRT